MPGGLTLLAGTDASIPTPATGKVTIYFSTDLGVPAYKDDAGVVHSIIGPTGPSGAVGPMYPPMDGDDGMDGFNVGVSQNVITPGLFLASRSITDTEIKSLSTVPIEVVAAQGATKVVIPIALGFRKKWANTYSAARTFQLRYAGIATDLMAAALNPSNTTNFAWGRSLIASAMVADGTDVRNTGVVIRSNGDVTGGDASNTLEVSVWYTVQEVGA